MATLSSINNGESGLDVRTKINDNAAALNAELIQQSKLSGQTANVTEVIAAGGVLVFLIFKATNETTIKAGTTAGGDDIYPETTIAAGAAKTALLLQAYTSNQTIYYTITGTSPNIDIISGTIKGIIS